MNYCGRRAITRASGRCKLKRSFEACLLWCNVLLHVTIPTTQLPQKRMPGGRIVVTAQRGFTCAYKVHADSIHTTVASCEVRFAVRFTRRVSMRKERVHETIGSNHSIIVASQEEILLKNYCTKTESCLVSNGKDKGRAVRASWSQATNA